MSHNLRQRADQSYDFAYFDDPEKGVPWHGLGTPFSDRLTIQEAARTVHLPHVRELEVYCNAPFEEGALVQTKLPLKAQQDVLSGKVLGTVSQAYQTVQFYTLLEMFEIFFGKGAKCVDSVGVLGQGEKFFASCDVGYLRVVKGDWVKKHLGVTSGHGGLTKATIGRWSIRTVCENTLNANLSGRGGSVNVELRHTAGIWDKLDQIKAELNSSAKFWDSLQTAYQALAAKELDGSQLRAYLEEIFPFTPKEDVPETPAPILKARSRVEDLFGEGKHGDSPHASGDKTRWKLFNDVCWWVDNEQPSRGYSDQTRWVRSMFVDKAQETRQRALSTLLTSV